MVTNIAGRKLEFIIGMRPCLDIMWAQCCRNYIICKINNSNAIEYYSIALELLILSYILRDAKGRPNGSLTKLSKIYHCLQLHV